MATSWPAPMPWPRRDDDGPVRGRFTFLDQATPIAFAHRGGAADGFENTARAFNHATGLGYHYLETDVHATADAVLVAFHNASLDGVTDGHGAIASLPWAEVAQARVRGSEPIPRLDDLLRQFPHARFNLEPKADGAVDPLITLLRQLDAVGRVCVTSFKGARVRRLRAALGNQLCTATGPLTLARMRLASWLPLGPLSRLVARTPAGCAQVPVRFRFVPIVDARFVRLAHRIGVQVHVWTINDRAEMEQLLDLGVDGIMTDDLELLKTVLQARGMWVDA